MSQTQNNKGHSSRSPVSNSNTNSPNNRRDSNASQISQHSGKVMNGGILESRRQSEVDADGSGRPNQNGVNTRRDSN